MRMGTILAKLSRSTVRTLASRIFLSLFLILSLMSSESARADDAIPMEVRPAGFYELVTSNDSSVCSVVLRSLNKKHSSPPPNDSISDNNRYVGKLLLTTDLMVNWHEVVGEGAIMDFAKTDFQNNGKPIMIYRTSFSLDGQMGDAVGPSTYDPGNIMAGVSLTPAKISEMIQRVDRGATMNTSPAEFTTPQWKKKKDKPSHIGYPAMLYNDVIVAAGKSYMLVTSALNADQYFYSYRDPRPNIDVYLLQYVGEWNIPMICHFRNKKSSHLLDWRHS